MAAHRSGAQRAGRSRGRLGRLPRVARRADQLTAVSLVFAAIAPHGTLPEAPVPGAEKTHEALAELGRLFDAAAPDTTIVMTPHNVHIAGHFAVVLAGAGAGALGRVGRPGGGRPCPPGRE